MDEHTDIRCFLYGVAVGLGMAILVFWLAGHSSECLVPQVIVDGVKIYKDDGRLYTIEKREVEIDEVVVEK